MPARKRKAEDFDPLKSDSEDSTYGASAPRSTKVKPAKSHRVKPSRKKQRRHDDDGEGSDEISDESELSEASFGRMEEDEPEIDERTGRPKRKAAKNRPAYQDGDTDDSIEDKTLNVPPKVTTPKKKGKGKSLVLKLNIGTPQPIPPPVKRNTRARSGSVSVARPNSSDAIQPTRRSSRINRDESEPIVQLTESGRHADIVRLGTRSPDVEILRAKRGGKGIKKPPASSIVFEQDEESSQEKKDQAQAEIRGSRDDFDEVESVDALNDISKDAHASTQEDFQGLRKAQTDEIPESADEEPHKAELQVVEEDDDDEEPINKNRRATRGKYSRHKEKDADEAGTRGNGFSAREAIHSGKTRSTQKGGGEESSDFEPGVDEGCEEDVSDSDASQGSPRKASQQQDDGDSSPGTRGAKGKPRVQREQPSDEHDSEVAEELAEELQDLRGSRPRRPLKDQILFDQKPTTRKRKPVDYRILRPDLALPLDDDGPPSAITPSRKGRGGTGGTWQRTLFSTYGPFGGAGGPTPVFGGPGGIAAAAGADTDSSDDEGAQKPRASGIGGAFGMTPTAAGSAGLGLLPPPPGQAYGADPHPGTSGAQANLGKIKDKQSLADADPLGIDQNIDFDSVGGLQGHIDQLKEMVALPLLYPEVFQRFHVTPPRGVLFHGPPGTGKTLLARALASSVSTQGRKVTFYMRKGADALSKWVGEAERQLRLLFEEARKTQPSIIFFDEIDGLAPVRSSKQEQIHASIVSTLLALMDGMDGRGQVIVIGATNRPDSIDPALRRPGRFDREFYFPLPNTEARRSILEIQTKGWDPPLTPSFKDEIASLTKGYGGADLRALCTEAALNAVQRRYPQIYASNEKLQIKPETINVTAKDFMISIKKMVPSSERSASSGAAPLPKHIEPLLRQSLVEIEKLVAEIMPQKKRSTALEEALFEDAEDDRGIRTERMQQEFERSRVFRPRLLLKGEPGMGQQYLASALLNHFEGLHVQALDLPTLLSDSSRSSEAAVIQLFTEVRRHKPSVIYIPNVDIWYRTVGDAVISTFVGLLRSLPPTDPVLLLGVLETDGYADQRMIQDLFGFSRRNLYDIVRPGRSMRREYFSAVIEHLNVSPVEFPDPANRKKRKLEVLMPVPPSPPTNLPVLSKAELKAQKKRDRFLLNYLKLRIQPIMDQIKMKFKKFRTGVIDENQIRYLYDEDEQVVHSDLSLEERRQEQYRPFEKRLDERGSPGLVETATGKFYYNLETVTIEKRLSNGYYKRPKDFLSDIKKLTKDAKTIGDQERLLKANELQANVEVDMNGIEVADAGIVAELEAVYEREMRREKEMIEKAEKLAAAEGRTLELMPLNVSHQGNAGLSTEQSSGPIVLGEPMSNGLMQHPMTPSTPSQPLHRSNHANGLSLSYSDLSNLNPHSNSNGTPAPSRGEGETHMTQSTGPSNDRETQNSSFGPSAQTQLPYAYTGGPTSLQQRLSVPGSLSQRSAITPMAEGSNPHDYQNSASTTSSEKLAQGSSGVSNKSSFKAKPDGPDLFLGVFDAPTSQLPDTQGTISPRRAQNFRNLIRSSDSQGNTGSNHVSSQNQGPSQSASQNPAVPLFPRTSNTHHASIHSILNDDAPPKTSNAVSKLLLDPAASEQLLEDLAVQSSGYSVEQLEQIYSALMDKIWRTRGEWNRAQVAGELRDVFKEVLQDIEACQAVGNQSMEAQLA